MLDNQRSRVTRIFPGVHYAWIIIAIAGFMHMDGGSVRQAFGVLIVPLQQDMGWSPASISLGYALASIVGAVLAPLSGMATDRYGPRKVMLVGILFFLGGDNHRRSQRGLAPLDFLRNLLRRRPSLFQRSDTHRSECLVPHPFGIWRGIVASGPWSWSSGDGIVPQRPHRSIDLEDGVLAHRGNWQRRDDWPDAILPRRSVPRRSPTLRHAAQ